MCKDSDSWSKDFSEKLSICEQENNRIMNSTTFYRITLNVIMSMHFLLATSE